MLVPPRKWKWKKCATLKWWRKPANRHPFSPRMNRVHHVLKPVAPPSSRVQPTQTFTQIPMPASLLQCLPLSTTTTLPQLQEIVVQQETQEWPLKVDRFRSLDHRIPSLQSIVIFPQEPLIPFLSLPTALLAPRTCFITTAECTVRWTVFVHPRSWRLIPNTHCRKTSHIPADTSRQPLFPVTQCTREIIIPQIMANTATRNSLNTKDSTDVFIAVVLASMFFHNHRCLERCEKIWKYLIESFYMQKCPHSRG